MSSLGFVPFLERKEKEYQATPTGNDPAVSAPTVLKHRQCCVLANYTTGPKLQVFIRHTCSELIFFLHLPGVAITWYSIIKVPTKRAQRFTVRLPIAPWRKKNAKGFILRAFQVDGLGRSFNPISLRALPHSSCARQPYQTARRQMLFLAAMLAWALYDLNQTITLFAV
jgi:hypothetical protein